jgi:hypothetical protein
VKYLLDTCIVEALLKGEPGTRTFAIELRLLVVHGSPRSTRKCRQTPARGASGTTAMLEGAT